MFPAAVRPRTLITRSNREIKAFAKELCTIVLKPAEITPLTSVMFAEAASGRVGRLIAGHALRSADWEDATSGSSWHLSPRECPGGPATLLGVSAAALTIQVPETVYPELSLDRLYDELVI